MHAGSPFEIRSVVSANTRHGWRLSLSVIMGVATATAVIVGALLVGDSMRGSLRALTIERLGKTNTILAPGSFFASESIVKKQSGAAALIFFPTGVVETKQTDNLIRRAGHIQIIGCDAAFWDLGTTGIRPKSLPTNDGVVLNQSAASELGVSKGDQVTLRLPIEQAVPADSPLGRREIQSEGLPRMEVLDVIPDRGLGRFAITPSQAAPLNIFVRRDTVAEVLDRQGQANVVLFPNQILIDDLDISLEQLGMNLRRIRKTFPANEESAKPIFDYYSLTSDRLLLDESATGQIESALGKPRVRKVMTYLANAIERVDESGEVTASVPYSTISAIDSTQSLTLNFDTKVEQSSDTVVPLVLNSWAAERLNASIGTPLRIAYFEPEVENGREIERYFSGIVADIVPITKPTKPHRRSREAVFDQPPTVYNDPDLTPTVPGVTDQESINDWDLPFQLTRKISSDDDAYWNNYRLTPKVFLPLKEGQHLFGSRFGQTTGLRIAPDITETEDELRMRIREAIEPSLASMGWQMRAIRSSQLAASRGTTPFDALFLSLSFFVILAAVLLISMLYRLGMVQRQRQLGTLLAVGWTPSRVRQLVLTEGFVVALGGVALGLVAGIGYARFVLWALRSWWVGAVTVPFLNFHWTTRSLAIGALASLVVAMLTLAFTIRSIIRRDVQGLLTGKDQDQESVSNRAGQTSQRPPLVAKVAYLLISFGVIVAAWGATKGGQAAAGGFVGGGMCLLIAMLMIVYSFLRKPRQIQSHKQVASYSLASLASRAAGRNPLRSTLTIGLMATAAFLIIAITAFQLSPTENGTGGFDLIAQTSQPLYKDLSDETVRRGLLGPDNDVALGAIVASLRMRPGQDASCNNLYQATNPTVLGVPSRFGSLFSDYSKRLAGFEWASYQKSGIKDAGPSWRLLEVDAIGTQDDPIPVVIDLNTAMWSLQMQKGIGEVRGFEFEPGKTTYIKVVGLLSNSVLQGRLMISESNFETLFPNVSGYQFFLIDAADPAPLGAVLENRLGDVGMDISDAKSVLSSLMAVQNTYLRTFQSLGALGLLLGTIGLAVAQLRSVLERRGELAVMRAIGFTRGRLAKMVLGETSILLVIGIGCGAFCAILAVFPYGLITGIRPPWKEPLIIVFGVLAFGLLAGMIAVRQILKMPLLESLRSCDT